MNSIVNAGRALGRDDLQEAASPHTTTLTRRNTWEAGAHRARFGGQEPARGRPDILTRSRVIWRGQLFLVGVTSIAPLQRRGVERGTCSQAPGRAVPMPRYRRIYNARHALTLHEPGKLWLAPSALELTFSQPSSCVGLAGISGQAGKLPITSRLTWHTSARLG